MKFFDFIIRYIVFKNLQNLNLRLFLENKKFISTPNILL